MAGLERNSPIPTEIKLHQQSRLMEVAFSDGASFQLPYELLRVYSPSAEVRGHGPGQEVLQTGKRRIAIKAIEPVGNYAIKPSFSDGHDSGIYSWDLLYHLGAQQQALWQEYLSRLRAAGLDPEAGRDIDNSAAATSDATPAATPAHGCGKH